MCQHGFIGSDRALSYNDTYKLKREGKHLKNKDLILEPEAPTKIPQFRIYPLGFTHKGSRARKVQLTTTKENSKNHCNSEPCVV